MRSWSSRERRSKSKKKELIKWRSWWNKWEVCWWIKRAKRHLRLSMSGLISNKMHKPWTLSMPGSISKQPTGRLKTHLPFIRKTKASWLLKGKNWDITSNRSMATRTCHTLLCKTSILYLKNNIRTYKRIPTSITIKLMRIELREKRSKSIYRTSNSLISMTSTCSLKTIRFLWARQIRRIWDQSPWKNYKTLQTR